MEVPSAESREVVIRPDEFAWILSFVRDAAFRQLLVTAWQTGARPQEILAVTASHVDLVGSRWVFKKSEEKMKRRIRVVYLTEEALEITKRLMAQQPSGPLFRNSRGKPWSSSSVSCQFKRLKSRIGLVEYQRLGLAPDPAAIAALQEQLSQNRRRAEVKVTKTERELYLEARRRVRNRQAAALSPSYSLYALRHSFATRALEQGVDALTVGALMGHADGGSTLARVYAHFTPTSLMRAMLQKIHSCRWILQTRARLRPTSLRWSIRQSSTTVGFTNVTASVNTVALPCSSGAPGACYAKHQADAELWR
jgi:integrase